MKRHLLAIFIILTTFLPVSVHAWTTCEAEGKELVRTEEVEISYSQRVLSVMGAEGDMLEVVSLTGRRMLSLRIDNPVQRIELNVPKGCYIVKIGNVVRKISVQ